jgi:acyl dehydratase
MLEPHAIKRMIEPDEVAATVVYLCSDAAGSQTLAFRRPVRIGDAITAAAEVLAYDPDRRRLTLRTTCTNQRGETVLEGEAAVLVDQG